MYVDGNKIKVLVENYGKQKGYPDKSHMARFCEDFNLNYNQWNAYSRGGQVQNLQKILGHSNINETMVYVHIVQEEMDREIMIMDQLLMGGSPS